MQVTAGAELGGQVAGALAAASMLFKSSDPAYAATLVDGATRAYAFAQNSNKVKCGALAQAMPSERTSALCGTTRLCWLGELALQLVRRIG